MWIDILQIFLGFLGGVVVGFFVSKKLMTKYLQKNPPINEDMIKTLMMQMGRKPSEAQIRNVMNSMKKGGK